MGVILGSLFETSFFGNLLSLKTMGCLGNFRLCGVQEPGDATLLPPLYCCYLRRRGALCACVCVGACVHAGMGVGGPFKAVRPFFSSSGSCLGCQPNRNGIYMKALFDWTFWDASRYKVGPHGRKEEQTMNYLCYWILGSQLCLLSRLNSRNDLDFEFCQGPDS